MAVLGGTGQSPRVARRVDRIDPECRITGAGSGIERGATRQPVRGRRDAVESGPRKDDREVSLAVDSPQAQSRRMVGRCENLSGITS
jgi:hypothetical protein